MIYSKLEGKTLSEGVSMGRVCLYREDILDAAPRRRIAAESVQDEKNRFSKAVEKTREDLRNAYDAIAKKLSIMEAEVFNAHLMILEDNSFISSIENYIANDLWNVETALINTVKGYEEKFSKLQNEYFRERMNDINDIARRLLNNLSVKHSGFMCSCSSEMPAAVVSDDLTSLLISGLTDKNLAGIVTEKGSLVSHGAVLARALGVPVIIGVKSLVSNVSCGEQVLIDADNGIVHINPSSDIVAEYSERLEKLPARDIKYENGIVTTKDGMKVSLLANASNIKDIRNAGEFGVKDIGLFRTEFFFVGRNDEPGVEEQADVYRRIMDSTEGTITFRLLDIGGDKILNFMSLPNQENPNMGIRGVRIYDKYPHIIENQVKALLLAKGKRPIKIMIPMVSTLDEFLNMKALVYKIRESLGAGEDITADNISIGCMIEIPSAVYLIKHFVKEADFLSIGTNDLIQYTMGADRGNNSLVELSDPFQPAVIMVLKEIIDSTAGSDVEVTVCGETAGTPEMAKILVGLGYRNLSISPYSLARVGAVIGASSMEALREEAAQVLGGRTLEEIKGILAGSKNY